MIRHPARLILRLESSAQGCRWLLDRWAELRSMLVREQVWQSPDKLKAIRLLGKYPLDALDDTRVTVVFLACHRIDSSGGELFHEIGNGLTSDHWEISKQRLAQLPIERLRPRDHAEASQALLQIVDQAVGRLATKAERIGNATSATPPPRSTDSHSTTVGRANCFAITRRRASEPFFAQSIRSPRCAEPVIPANLPNPPLPSSHQPSRWRPSNKESCKTNPISCPSKSRRSSQWRRSNRESGKTNPIPWTSKTRRSSRWRRSNKESRKTKPILWT